MFGIGKKKDVSNASKYRFEKPYTNHQSNWRKPQGSYHTDIDAHRKLIKFFRRGLYISQMFSIFLGIVFIFCLSYVYFSENYETVIMDDGSRLFCTVLSDGSIGIAY